MKPKIPPGVFKNPSVTTTKHDEMLLTFSKDSEELRKFIDKSILKIENPKPSEDKIFINKEQIVKAEVVFLSGYDNKHYYITNEERKDTDYYLTNIYDKFVQGEEGYKQDFLNKIKNGTIKKLENPKLHTKPILCTRQVEVEKWSPEHTIKNNGYYVGSVDLFVNCTFTFTYKLKITENRWWENYYEQHKEGVNFLIEFKPTIKSFSETIRQIKVYKSYLDNHNLFCAVVTYSDISKFKDVFESQNIDLIQLEKQKKLVK